MNPLSRLLAGVVAALALVGAFFFGIFVLALVIGAGLVAWLVFWLRIWWLKRKLPGEQYGPYRHADVERKDASESSGRKGEIIDAEYEVVSRKKEE